MKNFKLNDKMIGEGQPPYFIADIAANHDGELDRALMLIELAKEAGAHAAKFQNFKAARIVSRRGFDKLGGQLSHQKNWKKCVYEVYEDASISTDWTPILKAKCDEVGIEYFTSPYDKESVDHVDPFVSMYKIGSGDITWTWMLEYIGSKGKPILIATGASEMADVTRAMAALEKHTRQIVLMQCNTNYTGSDENFKYINLNVLKAYAQAFPNTILGLSDHTHGHSTILGAQALGATVFEKHFTDDNGRDGPDHRFAMTPTTWREMVNASMELFYALGDGEKVIEGNEVETASVQRRGIRYSRDLKSGSKINDDDIFPLRPYKKEGLHPYESHLIVGFKLTRDVKADQLVRKGDLSK